MMCTGGGGPPYGYGCFCNSTKTLHCNSHPCTPVILVLGENVSVVAPRPLLSNQSEITNLPLTVLRGLEEGEARISRLP